MQAVAEGHSAQPVLTCQRLRLRPIGAEDDVALHSLFSDAETMRFMDFLPTQTLADTAKRLEAYLFVLPAWHATWVIEERTSSAVIGFANYHHRENWNQRLEIGFVLARTHWRQGLMREAVGALLDHCFGGLDMHRVEATVNPCNESAMRLLDALGFRFEGGLMRRRQRVGCEFRDQLMYGLLREEWRGSPARAIAEGRRAAPIAGDFGETP